MLIEKKTDSGWMWLIDCPLRGHGIGPSLLKHLAEACQNIEIASHQAPQSVRTLIIGSTPSGKTRPIWIAGGDLKELSELKTKAQCRAYIEAASAVMNRLESLPFPVIMCIDGDAIGGGAEFALSGDIRLGTMRSNFIFKQMEIGLATGYGSCQRMINLIGKAKAQNILLRGLTLNMKQAAEIGLIHEICNDRDHLFAQANTIAKLIAKKPYLAVKQQKLMLNLAVDYKSNIAEEKEWDAFETLWMNPVHKNYLDNFLKKKHENHE